MAYLDKFSLEIIHRYLSNQNTYKNALKDGMIDNLSEQFDDEYSELLDDEEDGDQFIDSKKNEIKEILLDIF